MGFFKTVAAGGQTWAHGIRMLRQVFVNAFLVSVLISVIFTGWNLSKESKKDYTFIGYHLLSWISGLIGAFCSGFIY